MAETFLNGKVTLHRGSCLDLLPELPENSIDSCVTDPPYHLTSIVKRFGKTNSAPCQHGTDGAYARASKGFMGKQWDGGDIAFQPLVWELVFRALKPGAHLLAFSGTRTYHRMACAIEDAGFEIRDQIQWLYGSGFPKSHNIDNGLGTALKPANEPICLARKPLSESSIAANVLEWGTGALNIDQCRIEGTVQSGAGATGFGSRDGNYELGTGRQYQSNGRWPANLIHDGSEEVLAGFPQTASRQDISIKGASAAERNGNQGSAYGKESRAAGSIMTSYGDEGSAARFFYTSKADADDRLGSKHPTVKPLDLIQYLLRLITPKDGLVLDPFSGTGTTGEAAFREGFKAILIEREEEYQADIVKRMGLCLAGPDQRRAATVTQLPFNDLPMFAQRDEP